MCAFHGFRYLEETTFPSVGRIFSRYSLIRQRSEMFLSQLLLKIRNAFLMCMPLPLILLGARIAQLVESPTEKSWCNTGSGSSPRWVKGFFIFFNPQSASSADSLTVSLQPLCAIACIDIHAHVKNTRHWQPCHCLDTRKCHTH